VASTAVANGMTLPADHARHFVDLCTLGLTQHRDLHVLRPGSVWQACELTAAQKAEARRRRAQGATLAELARSYGVGKSTISQL
jgi:hypothetical protein